VGDASASTAAEGAGVTLKARWRMNDDEWNDLPPYKITWTIKTAAGASVANTDVVYTEYGDSDDSGNDYMTAVATFTMPKEAVTATAKIESAYKLTVNPSLYGPTVAVGSSKLSPNFSQAVPGVSVKVNGTDEKNQAVYYLAQGDTVVAVTEKILAVASPKMNLRFTNEWAVDGLESSAYSTSSPYTVSFTMPAGAVTIKPNVEQVSLTTFSTTPADAAVTVKDAKNNTVSAEEDGKYALRVDSVYTYEVARAGYTTKSDTLTVPSTAATTVTVALEENASGDKAIVLAKDAGNAAAANTAVELFALVGDASASTAAEGAGVTLKARWRMNDDEWNDLPPYKITWTIKTAAGASVANTDVVYTEYGDSDDSGNDYMTAVATFTMPKEAVTATAKIESAYKLTVNPSLYGPTVAVGSSKLSPNFSQAVPGVSVKVNGTDEKNQAVYYLAQGDTVVAVTEKILAVASPKMNLRFTNEWAVDGLESSAYSTSSPYTVSFTMPAGAVTIKPNVEQVSLTTFSTTPADAAVTVKDAKNNTVSAEEDGKYALRVDSVYTYEVARAGYTTKSDTLTVPSTAATTVTVALEADASSDKDITAAVLLNAAGDTTPMATGSIDGTEITITLPSDTAQTVLDGIGSKYLRLTYPATATVGMSDGYNDTSGTFKWANGDVMCNMSLNSAKTFTVTAEDGTTKDYTITIKYVAPDAPALTAGAVSRTSDTAATVKFTSSEAGSYYYKVVASGAAEPTIAATGSGQSAVAGENTITLTNLTAGARDIYIVVKNAAGTAASAKLKIAIPAYSSGEGNYTITVSAPTGGTLTPSKEKANAGDTITVTVTPNSGYQMTADSLAYTLAVAGGETVKITNKTFTMPAGNITLTCKWETAATTVDGITGFSINGVAGAVNNSTNNITITMPYGTDVTKLVPTISGSNVASISPASGAAVNFTKPVTFTVTLKDGTVKTYTATVYVSAGSASQQMWDKLTGLYDTMPWWKWAEHQVSYGKYPTYW